MVARGVEGEAKDVKGINKYVFPAIEQVMEMESVAQIIQSILY